MRKDAVTVVSRLPAPADGLIDAGAWEQGHASARKLVRAAARAADRDRRGRETPVWLSGPLEGRTRIGGYTVRGWVIAVGGVLNAPSWLLAEVESAYLAARAAGTAQRAA